MFGKCSYECNPKLWENYDVENTTKAPLIVMSKLESNSYYISKFQYDYEEINVENLKNFIDRFLKGEV